MDQEVKDRLSKIMLISAPILIGLYLAYYFLVIKKREEYKKIDN